MMAAWKLAPHRVQPGDPREVVIVDVAEHTDRLGTVGLYTLTFVTGRTVTLFDHDPARLRAMLAARTAALREIARTGHGTAPRLLLTDTGTFHVVCGIGTYTLRFVPIAYLDQRQRCAGGQWRRAPRPVIDRP